MANEISLDPIAVLALAKTYTEETAKGGGAIAGKNIIVKGKANVTDAEGHITGVNLTVGYTLNDGTEKEEVLFLPAGPKGEKGEQGEQGEKGEDGTPGQDGQKGADGVSPSISVTPITGGHRVTITDATHDAGNPLTFDVMDGRDGSGAGGNPDWSNIQNKPENIVTDANYVHTDNNYSDEDKDKLDSIQPGETVTQEWNEQNRSIDMTVGTQTVQQMVLTGIAMRSDIAEAMTDVDNEHFHPIAALPDPADEDPKKRPKENHEYIVIEYEQDGTTIKSETHYLFYGGEYHEKKTTVSLDGYATEQLVNDGLATKQDTLTAGKGARIENNIIDTPLLDEVPAIGNRSSFYDEHFYESVKNTTQEYLAQYKSAEDRQVVYGADLTDYYWRIKYENNTEEFIDLRNRRITQAGTTDIVRYDAFKIFTDEPYKHMYSDITWIDINPNGDRIFVFGTYNKNVTEEQMGHPRAMSMTPYAKTTIKKVTDIVKADLFAQGIIEERGSDWGVAKSGRLRFVFATQQQEISDLWVDISELGLPSAEDYVVQLTITGGGTMDWGASELFVWEKRTTQFGVTCRNMTSSIKDYTIADYAVIAKGFGGGAGGSGGTVDQTYDATSENAQSGKAVAEALATVDGGTNFDVTPIPQGPTGANEINAVLSNKDNEYARLSYVRQSDGTLPNTVNLGVKSGLGDDSFELPTKPYVDSIANNAFVFDVDSDQFTEDPDNPDGKHYGMTITSPTYDELLALLQTNKFVYARLLYNSGNAYEIMQIFHNGNSIYGRYFDVEFPQKRLMFASAYVNKRNNNETYFGTSQDYIGTEGGTVDQTYDATSTNAQSGTAVAEAVGDLSSLTTTAQDNLVNAVNELKSNVSALGEPFRVKQWGSNTLNVEIPYCTEDIANGSIPKMVFSIDDVEGAEYQIVGMVAYEVFDAASGGNRINCWPVCQFTGNGQKELSVRWMCGGTTRKTAKRINAWVLLKHR